jgi:hypothetical protein
MSTPGELIAGTMDSKGRNLLANDVPNSTAAALGPTALVLAAVPAPYAAVALFFALVPFLLLHASHGGFVVLVLLTSPIVAGDWFSYAAVTGMIAVAIALAGIAQSTILLASRASSQMARAAAAGLAMATVVAWWVWVPRGVAWFLNLTEANPRAFVTAAAALGIPVIVLARWRPIDGHLLRSSRARICALATVAILAALAYGQYRTIVDRPAIVTVRWNPNIDGPTRVEIETKFSLTDEQDTSDAAVRSYTLADTSRGNVRALVQHPAVEDTQHLDRRTYDVERPPRRYDLSRNVPLFIGAAAVVWMIGLVMPLGASSRNEGLVALPAVVSLMAVLMAVPLVGLGRSESERVTLLDRLRATRHQPSVLDWNTYYDAIRTTINNKTPIRVPRTVVDELTARLPARTILLSNPDYSCALAALLDAYCINPKEAYGHFFLSAGPYLSRYRQIRDEGEAWHPFFNSSSPVDERERTLLKAYGVHYLLADPEHAAQIQQKLDTLAVPTTVEFRDSGFVLYHF